MNLAIVAATGGIGHQLLEQALAAGHAVTAVVRDAGRVSEPIRVLTTDLANPDLATIRSAIQDVDAVLSGLGARSAGDLGVAAYGTRAITQVMGAAAVRRIIVSAQLPSVQSRHLVGPILRSTTPATGSSCVICWLQ
jgi:putative NADH-flavin reductase